MKEFQEIEFKNIKRNKKMKIFKYINVSTKI